MSSGGGDFFKNSKIYVIRRAVEALSATGVVTFKRSTP
jgi:hypothetical protein